MVRGEEALKTVAEWLWRFDFDLRHETGSWSLEPSDEDWIEDYDGYEVWYLRDDPVGMPEGAWLWLHDEVEQLGWRKQVMEVLAGSTKPVHEILLSPRDGVLGDPPAIDPAVWTEVHGGPWSSEPYSSFGEWMRGLPPINVPPEVLTALLQEYDSPGGWFHDMFVDEDSSGGRSLPNWPDPDPWYARGVQLLGPPPVGNVWYLSTVLKLLEEHRPGALDRWA